VLAILMWSFLNQEAAEERAKKRWGEDELICWDQEREKRN
jgi:hypothetical protein